MTVTAIAEGFRVGQAYLGAKIHDAKDPGADLTEYVSPGCRIFLPPDGKL